MHAMHACILIHVIHNFGFLFILQIGTQILELDEKEELEKVQLLWSNNPVALNYVQVDQEHYLVIGQAGEASIVYLFSGS